MNSCELDNDDTAILLENVSKFFVASPFDVIKDSLFGIRKEKASDFVALDKISLKISKGESVGILGENGAGKSTLLQIVAKTLQLNSGYLYTRGKLAALLELGSGFNPEFTGRENILLNASIMGLSKSKIFSVLDDIIEFSQIGEFVEKPVKTYSSGMRVRLAFAVSVFVDPDILIIDEALSVGDIFFRKKCFEVIKKYTQNGGTLLFVSHNEDQLRLFANRVIVIFKGKIIFDGSPNEAISLYNEKIGDSRRAYYSDLSLKNIEYNHIKKASKSNIIKVEVLNYKDSVCNLFSYAETIKIKIFSVIGTPFKSLCFGILIRNKEGINVYSTETEPIDFSSFYGLKKGNRCEHMSSFEFSFPLGRNSYSVEAYMIERKEGIADRIDWISNASFFNISYPIPHLKTSFKGGVADLNAVKKNHCRLIETKEKN